MKDFQFTISSTLLVKKEQLWKVVTNMDGVNYELAPWVKMAVPKAYREFTITEAPLNEKLFTSVILLFGFIPVDLHSFKLEKVVNKERFEENSKTFIHYYWKHTRILKEQGEGTNIEDRIAFRPRLPLIGYLLKPIYQLVFKNRHQRLKKKYQE